MAERNLKYYDFALGEWVDFGPGDTIPASLIPPGGSGDVTGPASSVDDRIVTFDGITGKLIQDSGVLLSAKQDTLVSATNIKTINGSTILGAGDLVVSGASTEVTQTEIDFGTTPVQEGSFTISHTGADVNSKIVASLAYDAPTGKDLDELDMDDFVIKCGNATTDAFTMFVRTSDGPYVSDKFKINYIIYTPA